MAGSFAAGLKSLPVVLDDEEDVAPPALEDDFHVACVGVLGDVRERFLGNSVERRFGVGRQPVVEESG